MGFQATHHQHRQQNNASSISYTKYSAVSECDCTPRHYRYQNDPPNGGGRAVTHRCSGKKHVVLELVFDVSRGEKLGHNERSPVLAVLVDGTAAEPKPNVRRASPNVLREATSPGRGEVVVNVRALFTLSTREKEEREREKRLIMM